jgi:hypothetical protein
MKVKKSWQEKLADNKGLPRVERITEKMSKRWGTGTVVIPAPKEVDEIMKNVPIFWGESWEFWIISNQYPPGLPTRFASF